MYKSLEYDLAEGVASITLAMPDKHNPINYEVASELTDALKRADENPHVRAVVLSGQGDSFSAGGDIEQFSKQLDESATTIFSDGEIDVDLFKTLAGYETPLIGAINGSAYGGGCGLVSACHLAYAAEDARFGTTEITLGLFPMVIMPLLRRRIGDNHTLELALTGRRISASRAAEIGLVTETVSNNEVRDRAIETATEIASYSPFATGLGLHAFHQTSGLADEHAIELLNAYRVLFYKSHDLHEGAEAFLEDRDPEWKGY